MCFDLDFVFAQMVQAHLSFIDFISINLQRMRNKRWQSNGEISSRIGNQYFTVKS
jgi:hypothetical protein